MRVATQPTRKELAQARAIVRLQSTGEDAEQIQRALGISRRTYFRRLATAKAVQSVATGEDDGDS